MEEASEEPMCGVIERVRLVNFMNHDNFETSFGPHVNFICGENGSGKSALLTAITLCLGATSRFTKRASNVRGHVKHGRQAATIAVTLRNRGVDAYKPDEYGASVVVERRITAEGASDWKIKTASGAVVSTKRKELVRLVDALGIQVDNPCGILMQETSKRFLTGTRPDQLYKFFLEATQLAQMSSDYEAVSQYAESAMANIERKREALPNLHNRVEALKDELRSVRELDETEGKLNDLRVQLAWVIVRDREAEHAEAQRQRTVLQSTHEKLKRKEELLQGELAAIEAHVEEATAKSAKQQLALQAEEGRSRALTERSKELERAIGQDKARVRALGSDVRTAERRLKTVEEELATLRAQEESDTGDSTTAQMVALEAALAKVDAKLAAAHKSVSEAEAKKSACDEDVRAADGRLRGTRTSMERLTGEEKALQSNSGDAELRAFGTEMPQIVQTIRRHAREFRHVPIGPIGALVKVKEHAKVWTRALDAALGGHARAFIVDNHEDERRLRAVLSAARVRVPPMIVQAFRTQAYDIPRAQRPQGESVLEALEWAEAMAHNAMVDQVGVEGMILVKDRDEAARRVFNAKDRRVTCAFDENGTRYSLKGHTEVVQTALNHGVRITASRAERLVYLQQERATAQRTLAQHEVELRLVQNAQRAAGAELTAAKDEVNTLQRQRIRVCNDLSAAQGQHAGGVGTALGETIAQLEVTAEDLRRTVEGAKVDMERLAEAVRKQEVAREPLKVELLKHTSKVAAMQGESEGIEAALRQALTARDTAEQFLERVIIRTRQSDQQLYETEKRIKELEEVVKSESEAATRIAPRPENLSTASQAELQKDQLRLKRSLEQDRAGLRQLDLVLEELVAAKERERQLREDVGALQALQRALVKNLRQRRAVWVDMCTRYANRTSVAFQTYLVNRNFSGNTVFNHEESKLHINVAPRQDETEGPGKGSTQGLSGGERSFSTVALLLALWESMEQPFSAMDEFDVFMDQVNRRMAVKMLIETCAQQRQRQFIFISPHTLAHLTTMDPMRVKVIKMHPPERNQPPLPFGSQ